MGAWGLLQGAGKTVPNLSCDCVPGVSSNILQMNVPRVPGTNNNGNAFRPNICTDANVPSGNVTAKIGFRKPLNVYGSAGAGYGTATQTVAAAGGQCRFVDATIVKAIQAICVSADSHEFPASHMIGDTWTNAGYRRLPL